MAKMDIHGTICFYYTDYVFLLVAYCLVDNYLIGFPFLLGWFKRGIHEFSLSGSSVLC